MRYKHPFTKSENCAERLFQQWKEHNSLIIAVDFDDTVCPYKDDYDTSEVINILKRCNENNFKLIVFTASEKERFKKIEQFFEDNLIKIEGINKNLLDKIGNDGKIYYNLLLCDRAGLGQALETLEILLEKINKNTK